MTGHPRELHAFALGDLSGAAAAEVERHVAACARCRREVARLRQDHAALLDTLPPIPPADAARHRALAAARAALEATPVPVRPPSIAPRGRATAWAGWALAAVVAVAGIGVSWERHAAWRASDRERALVAAWLTRTDVTSWPLPAAPGGRSPGTVMVADDGVVLVVMRAPASAGHAYRAWGVGPDGATALGDVPRTVLRAVAAGYDEVLVSLEPRGAALGPTDPLGVAPLPHRADGR